MKKVMYIAGILLVAMAMLFVSCENEAGLEGGYSDLNLSLFTEGTTKALGTDVTYAAGMTVASYQYRATCTSTAGAQGSTSGWTSLFVTDTTTGTNAAGGNLGRATLRNLARGNWTIDVRALNLNGGVILQGQSSVILSTNGQDLAVTLGNNVTDYSVNPAGAETVSVGITVPKLAAGSMSVKVTGLANVGSFAADGSYGTAVEMSSADGYRTDFNGAGIAHSTEAAGMTAYYGSVDLVPGLYAMQILYKDGSTVISGQTFAFRVNEKAPFAINGTLTAGEFLNLDLSPITEDSRTVSLEWAVVNSVTVGTPTADEGVISADIDASSAQGTLANPTYLWFIDGVLETNADTENASAGKLTSTRVFGAGRHVVTCIVSATIGGYDSVGCLSAEVDID